VKVWTGEIGELAEAFNAMADEIQEYIQKVEAAAKETEQLFMDSIRAIANALDAKDPYTRGHSERVSAYAMIVSRLYGLDERQLRIMEISSLLHDVGKIGIEDKILRKPGALTNEEFSIMKTHPPKGAEIMGSIPQMKEMIPGIRHHHEKWSGGGYPDSLKGEKIPIIPRIIGVADAFDAMTTNRPYQRAMTFIQASSRINELTPLVYDPKVTEAFNAAFQKGLFRPFEVRPDAAQKPA
jgi:HD-GYP domain-containing protein (c-di-GMP phosphodiesterase class II)